MLYFILSSEDFIFFPYFSLQKFKMNIANTVINQENYSLASMGTEQLLDLFCLDRAGKPTEKAAASTATSQQSTKTVLENLGELWDTTQYESEYDLNSFMQGLKHVSWSKTNIYHGSRFGYCSRAIDKSAIVR